MTTPHPLCLLGCATLALSIPSSVALATPASCTFGRVVEVYPDAHSDKGCQIHLVVQRGDLVETGLELDSSTLKLDLDQIQLKSSAGVHGVSAQKLTQLGAHFSTRRTDCDCTAEFGWYVFDHYLLIPDQRLPPSATIKLEDLPSAAEPPEQGAWSFTTTAATQGPGCSPLGSLTAGQGPRCGTCDRCPGDDAGITTDGGSDSGVANKDQGASSLGDGFSAADGATSSPGSSGCAMAAGVQQQAPLGLLLLLLLACFGRGARAPTSQARSGSQPSAARPARPCRRRAARSSRRLV